MLTTSIMPFFLAIALLFVLPAQLTDDAAWVKQRVQQMQPTAQERRIDQIGWAKDIREALRLAKENRRPIFLFTHDGRIATGRC